MIRFESSEIEREVLAGLSCIAVPIEIFEKENAEPEITTYSVCKDEAEEFYRLYKDDILGENALNYLENTFSAIADKMGYIREKNENELMLEYIMTPDSQLPEFSKNIKVHKISSNAVLFELCRASGCDIEINDDGEDVLFAIVNNGVICAYAGMNDVIYSDNSVEISVETAPECRRLGYGIACVSALCNHLISKGVCIRYKCSADNLASLALAEKCGFKKEGMRFSFVCYKE